jgi:hypothetical protein
MPESTKYTPTTLDALIKGLASNSIETNRLRVKAGRHIKAWEAQLAAARRLAEAVQRLATATVGYGVPMEVADELSEARGQTVDALAAWREADA